MPLQKILPFCHALLQETVQAGDTVIDGTCGNGHDTLLLARLVGPTGHVYGFDIQEAALESTRERLDQAGERSQVSLIHASHADFSRYVSTTFKAGIFNLGYLPGGDKTITTRPESTIASLRAMLPQLEKDGLLILVVYHGHPEGKIEKEHVLSYVQNLPQENYQVLQYGFINQRNSPPFVLAIQKK
ncbi:class I SAM-dependent methyltransferase [Listeria costaricensis]|uniref:class I SAM-dependent methyltransferase n=1 Tax=Listeria costaricensis TaxID=2026604 RepID=UPI000C075C8E|nr:class I SAM-dependent methyltransferase [Listeria costaricensis]